MHINYTSSLVRRLGSIVVIATLLGIIGVKIAGQPLTISAPYHAV